YSLAVEGGHECQRIARNRVHARLPGGSAIGRATEKEHGARTVVAEAGEVPSAIGAERRRRIASEISITRTGYIRIVRKARDSRNEAVRQRFGPRLSAVERRIHTAAVVEVPIVIASDQVLRVAGIHRQ